MTKCNYIDDYISAIRRGPASKEMVLVADYIERKLSPPADVIVDVAKIDKAVELIERYFEMTLLPWELFALALVHCYYHATNAVVFDEYFIMMGRGNGKNGFVSAIAWYLTTHYHGVEGYNVDIIANSEDQAKTSFEDIYDMLSRTWEKSRRFFYKSRAKIVNTRTNSYIRYNTSNARTKDGKRSACLIFDEEHEYENSKTIGVFQSGFGKRKHSRVLKITTNGYVRDGVLDDDLRISHDVLNGIIPDSGLCPLIYKMDNDDECENADLWVKANPSLPYFPELRTVIEKEFVKKQYDKQTELDFYTKRMNLPRTEMEVHVTEYDNIRATACELPDLSGRKCVVGIDYASISDWAAVNYHFREGNIRYDINHVWVCAKSKDLHRIRAPWQQWSVESLITVVDDVEINPELLAADIADMAKKYMIYKIALDGFRYALVSKALSKIGFDAADRKNVYLVRPSDIYKIVPVVASAFNNQHFVWGDNPVLRWATNNTKLCVKGKAEGSDTGNSYYGKIEGKSRKTDPFMALVASMVIEGELGDGMPLELPDIPVFTY